MSANAMPALSCDEISESLAAYALGALERSERDVIEDHLAICAACSLELARQQQTVDALAGAVRPMSPAPDLRARLMAEITKSAPSSPPPAPIAVMPSKPRRAAPRWILPAVSIAATFLLVGVGILGVLLTRALDQRDQAADTAQLLSTYVSAGGHVVTLQAQPVSLYQSYDGRGSLLTAPGKTPVVVVAGCPKSGDYLTYWVWFSHDGQRVPAGKLTVGGDGSGWIALDSNLSLADFDTVGITIEVQNNQREDVLVAPLNEAAVS